MLQSYNALSSRFFDFLMAPFGHEWAVFDLLFWPVVMGIGALQVYKYASNQKAITRIKTQISMHLLEIRLFSHDIVQVLKSTVTIVAKNTLYIGHNLLPLAVMIVPMMALMVQLVAHYAYAPSAPGSVELLHLRLDPAASLATDSISLDLPRGVSLDAPPVRTADGQVFWRLRADRAGDHVLRLRVGRNVYEKRWAVGGGPRKIPVKRLQSWEALLYPGEAAIRSGSPVLSLEMPANPRPLPWLPDGEFGILMWFMVLSMLAGVSLKGVFGVTL